MKITRQRIEKHIKAHGVFVTESELMKLTRFLINDDDEKAKLKLKYIITMYRDSGEIIIPDNIGDKNYVEVSKAQPQEQTESTKNRDLKILKKETCQKKTSDHRNQIKPNQWIYGLLFILIMILLINLIAPFDS